MELIIKTPKLFKPFFIENKAGKCKILIENNPDAENIYDIELQDTFGTCLGREELGFNFPKKSIYGLSISTNSKLRQSGYKIGETIRLASIMELMENKLQNIEIYAARTAVYFHAKYGFAPNLTRDENIIRVLRGLGDDIHPDFRYFRDRATEMLDSRDFAGVNKLVNNYLQKVLSHKYNIENHDATASMPMILERDYIKTHAEQYNQLYLAHKIDYSV